MSLVENKSLDELLGGQTFIYVNKCAICKSMNEYSKIIEELRSLGKEVVTKQISLWHGWQVEAAQISEKKNVELPFIFDYDTQMAIQLPTDPKEVKEMSILPYFEE